MDVGTVGPVLVLAMAAAEYIDILAMVRTEKSRGTHNYLPIPILVSHQCCRGLTFAHATTILSFLVGLPGGPEIKQLPHRHPQPVCHLLQHLKARSVDSPLNQAQEIDTDSDQFRKLLLREVAFFAD